VSQELVVESGGGPVVTDPNVTINVTFAGANGATSFTDVLGNDFTGEGGATISTEAPLYPPSSGLIPTTSGYFQSSDTSGAVLGAGDFAIEAWFETDEDEITLADAQGDEPGGWVLVGDSAGSHFFLYSEGGMFPEAFLGPLGLNFKGAGPQYVCVQRNAGVIQWFFNTKFIFYNTVEEGQDVSRVPTLLTLGQRQESPTSRPFTGKYGGFRVTVGGHRHEAEDLLSVPSPYDLIA
jgi:hypothetical protein